MTNDFMTIEEKIQVVFPSADAVHHILAIDTLPDGRGNTYSKWKSGQIEDWMIE